MNSRVKTQLVSGPGFVSYKPVHLANFLTTLCLSFLIHKIGMIKSTFYN